jgi:hypothetical protein
MNIEEIIDPFLEHIGVLQLLRDDSISEVMISDGRCSIDRNGKLEMADSGRSTSAC